MTEDLASAFSLVNSHNGMREKDHRQNALNKQRR